MRSDLNITFRPRTERSTSIATAGIPTTPGKDLQRQQRRNLRESAAVKGKRSQRIRSASVGRDRRSDLQVGSVNFYNKFFTVVSK